MDTGRNPANGDLPTNRYTVYAAGGIFTQHDLAANVLIKDAVWRQSDGKFELLLPQSKEMRELDISDLAAYIRNADLLQVLKADIFLARFDGLELDAGTVIEFMLAKFLGKPAVIWRCDSRRLGGENLDEPYNLMVKNWPRTVEFQFDSLLNYIGDFAKEANKQGELPTVQAALKVEMITVMKGIDAIASKIIAALDAALKLASPYPQEYQESIYQAARFMPGAGFEAMITEGELAVFVDKFRQTGTL